MRQRKLTNWLKSYIELTEDTEAPELFHFWTGVSTIAAALQNKCFIENPRFKWVPNFYIILVGPPAVVKKSTTIGVGQGIAAKVPRIKLGPDSTTWQALIRCLEQSAQTITMPNLVLDPTTGLPIPGAPPITKSISAVSLYISELEVAINLEDHDMLIFLTNMWDGKDDLPWQRITKTSGSNTLENPCVNLIACTTPHGLSNMPKKALLGGFMSRTILVYSNKTKKDIAYPADHPQWYLALRQKLVDDLEDIVTIKGNFTLTKDAIAFGEAWYHQYTAHLNKLDDEVEQNLQGRAQAHIHKLALVLSASRGGSQEITKADLKEALAKWEETRLTSEKVMHMMISSNGQDRAMHLWEIIQKTGSISFQDLYNKVILHSNPKEFRENIDSLKQAGRIEEVIVGKQVYIKRKP